MLPNRNKYDDQIACKRETRLYNKIGFLIITASVYQFNSPICNFNIAYCQHLQKLTQQQSGLNDFRTYQPKSHVFNQTIKWSFLFGNFKTNEGGVQLPEWKHHYGVNYIHRTGLKVSESLIHE